MNREELERYITETYGAQPDFPWQGDPQDEVFRHQSNRKWFALVMDIPKSRLGLAQPGEVSVVNLKCGPIMAGSLRGEPGFFPAYHMNRENWVTAALDGSAAEDRLKLLLDLSFQLTDVKLKKPPVSGGEGSRRDDGKL